MKRILTSLLVIITILTVIPVSSISASAAEKTVRIQYIDVNPEEKEFIFGGTNLQMSAIIACTEDVLTAITRVL